jgi:hypothetical protein
MAYEGTISQSHLEDLAGPSGAPEKINYADNVQNMFAQQAKQADVELRRAEAEKQQAISRTIGYMDAIPDGVETSKVPAKYSAAIQSWSKQKQQEAADYANEIALAEQAGDFQSIIHYKQKFQEVENAFANLNDNLTNFKSYKDQWIDDVDNGNLSNGNNGKKIGLLGNVYTDTMDMQFSDGGDITFTNEEGFVDFHKLPNYVSKNNKGATTILETNESLYNSGQRLTNSKRLLLKNKLKSLTQDRDELMSLATDDFIIEGGLGITDQALLHDPNRTSELRDKVINSYMNIFSDSANSGYVNKTSKTTTSGGGGTQSDRKYNAMMNNISQGYSLLADGELDAISRVIKGEMLFDEDEQQFYYTKGTNVFLPIDPNNPADITKIYNHEGIPQNYWGEIKLDTPTTNESSGDYDNL